jgi:glycosyltransferase involved in cell wall biosynthesis
MEPLRVALIGVYPPPYGGVSIHIQRLLDGCLNNGIQCTVFDRSLRAKKVPHVLNYLRIWNWPRVLGPRWDIFHVHAVDWNWQIPEFFHYLATMKHAKLLVSYHAMSHSPQEFSHIGRWMTRDVLKSAAHCIAVNEEIKGKLVSLGAMPEKVSIVLPYLPPVVKEEEIAAVPPQVWTFMAAHKPIISANAFAIVRNKGEDLYGIDMCIELCAALKSIYPGIGLVFSLPSIRDHEYFRELKRRIAEKGIENNFLFQTTPCQLYPILMKSDIFVRPTLTDSYGVSVAEAIHFRVPAVASDVCQRPEGTVLFKNRATADFIDRVKSVWENYGEYKTKLESPAVTSPLHEILKIYRRLTGRE